MEKFHLKSDVFDHRGGVLKGGRGIFFGMEFNITHRAEFNNVLG